MWVLKGVESESKLLQLKTARSLSMHADAALVVGLFRRWQCILRVQDCCLPHICSTDRVQQNVNLHLAPEEGGREWEDGGGTGYAGATTNPP